MTIFVMGHGDFMPPDTYVPVGTKVGVYANEGERLALVLGMAVLAKPGGLPAVRTFGGVARAEIRNYRVEPLTRSEKAAMDAVAAPSNKVVFIGYSDGYRDPVRLCEQAGTECADGVHRCQGLLGRIKDPDIRLAFCLGKSSLAGLTGMTGEFPDLPAYHAVRADLAAYRLEAEKLAVKAKANAADVVPSLERLRAAQDTAARTAFLIASSRKLELRMLRYRTRQEWQQKSPAQFLEYLATLPEEWRHDVFKKVVPHLPAEPDGAPTMDTAADAAAFTDRFLRAGTDQRYAAWQRLAPEQQNTARHNTLINHWADTIVPLVALYKAGAEAVAPKPQPLEALRALAHRAPSEFDDMEAQTSVYYRICRELAFDFLPEAKPATKATVWKQAEPYPAVRTLLGFMSLGNPADWGEPPANHVFLPPASKTAQALAVKPAPPAAAPEREPEPEADDIDFDHYERTAFWDDADDANKMLVRHLETGQTILVCLKNAPQAGAPILRMVLTTEEPGFAVGENQRATYIVSAVGERDVTIHKRQGDLDAALRAYIAAKRLFLQVG